MDEDESDWRQELQTGRAEKTATYEDSTDSPLSESARETFEGLSWFPIDESYRVTARFEHFKTTRSDSLEATRGSPMSYDHVGQLGVTFDGDLTVLSVYRAPGVESLLLPFRDRTNGETTWKHGRYLTIDPPPSEESGRVRTEVRVDFNRAYQPLCVYDDSVRSAKPPADNEIPHPIRAGERR